MKITHDMSYSRKTNFFDPLTASYMPKDHEGKFKNIMTKAIKDFKDEYFTGLTDEEREQIDKEIQAYIQSHTKNNKVDLSGLSQFIQHLLASYGYKGNLFEATRGLITLYTEEDGTPRENRMPSDKMLSSMRTPVQFSLASQAVLSGLHSTTDHEPFDEKDPLVTKIIENADGSKTVLMMRHQQIVYQIRLSQAASPAKND